MPEAAYRERNRRLLAHGLGAGETGDDERVDAALDALDAVAERPVRSTVDALSL
jgi:putative NIF3 family GTP cyclohydrolase 1 type 2